MCLCARSQANGNVDRTALLARSREKVYGRARFYACKTMDRVIKGSRKPHYRGTANWNLRYTTD
jgi:hypothetical protein